MRVKRTISSVCPHCGRSFIPTNRKNRCCSRACSVALRYPNSATPVAIAEWFHAHVNKTGGCWLWTDLLNSNGYGVMSAGQGRQVLSHRYAWEEATGEPVPSGMKVLHTCDVRNCVRNDDEGVYEVNGVLLPRRGHLFLGTIHDNNTDMAAKGRAHNQSPRGESNARAKLTEDDVRTIRQRYAAGGGSYATIAACYGVTPRVIWLAVQRLTWAHVD